MTALPLRHLVPGTASASVTTIGDRRVIWAEVDPTERRGALSSSASLTIATAADTARLAGLPLVLTMGSAGADLAEGVSALHGWGVAARAMAACSGRVPTLVVVDGPAVSGPALLLGLADIVVMTERSYAFMSGPSMVADFTGVDVSLDELGGPSTHARHTGAVALLANDVAEAHETVSRVLAHLPDHADDLPPRVATDDPVDRATPEAGEMVPGRPNSSYDVRSVVRCLVDDGHLLELRDRWAPNIVTGLASIGGRPVGLVANQPLALAGTLDIAASQKAARFVSFCDAFNLAIVSLVDTPGFSPGKDLEWRGMIRHGAQLVAAYARATVPRVGVILRKSYGGAYIVMDSKTMGNDVSLAWPSAELAVMGSGQAAAILQRRATPEERSRFEAEYATTLLNPYVAAERGLVDAVIEPAQTRRAIAGALAVLDDKRERLVARKHDNSPL